MIVKYYKYFYEWGWGIGDGGLGIGDWAQSPIPNPQSPIPNPQSPIPIFFKLSKEISLYTNKFKFISVNIFNYNNNSTYLIQIVIVYY